MAPTLPRKDDLAAAEALRCMSGKCTIAYATEVAPRFFHLHDPAYGQFQAEEGGPAQCEESRALGKEQTNDYAPVQENPYGLGQGRREGGETQAAPSMTLNSYAPLGWQYERAAY